MEANLFAAMLRSDMMFTDACLPQKEAEQIEVHGAENINVVLNCRIGRQYPVPYASGIHPGGFRYHWFETAGEPHVRDCKETEVCSLGGKRSRKEWCGDCDRIV